jgi:hypothetical protein
MAATAERRRTPVTGVRHEAAVAAMGSSYRTPHAMGAAWPRTGKMAG